MSVSAIRFQGLYSVFGPKEKVEQAVALLRQRLEEKERKQEASPGEVQDPLRIEMMERSEWSGPQLLPGKNRNPYQSVVVATTQSDVERYHKILAWDKLRDLLHEQLKSRLKEHLLNVFSPEPQSDKEYNAAVNEIYRQVDDPQNVASNALEMESLVEEFVTLKSRVMESKIQSVIRTELNSGFAWLPRDQDTCEYWDQFQEHSYQAGKVLKWLKEDRFDVVNGGASPKHK